MAKDIKRKILCLQANNWKSIVIIILIIIVIVGWLGFAFKIISSFALTFAFCTFMVAITWSLATIWFGSMVGRWGETIFFGSLFLFLTALFIFPLLTGEMSIETSEEKLVYLLTVIGFFFMGITHIIEGRRMKQNKVKIKDTPQNEN